MQLGLMKISFNDYCAIDAINSSKLKEFFSDQKLFYKTYITKEIEPEPEGRHMTVGRLVHCMVLEPEKFNECFMVGDYRRSSKAGLTNLAIAKASGMSVVSEDELELASTMAEELPDQDQWTQYFTPNAVIHVEVVIVIQIGNIYLKVMLDRCIEHPDVVYIDDVKSTSKSNDADFDGAITEYDYLLQYAFYRFVAEKHFGKPVVFRFVFCSKNQPYNVAFITMSDQHYAVGFDVINKALTMYIEAQKTGIWYNKQVAAREAVIPKYQMQKYYNFLGEK